ncbi:hypothetical protein S7335_2131 [Synechococcus sp. PCC 7335]|uniref:type II toxin-antitoxin system VapC family toxin n=1 Tax=Synechococcus sp. (strain ATCC 29403 / PCC 7335) TaxID=91464 RepID=UPI00017EE3DA|nr:PIN domain-containing protein [Synechococcus sp. PCC 7335]EDX84434.1 hypothetical protein S7335_2131 [Synechococcus sp. PCC 7335]
MPKVIILDTHIWLWQINANFDRFPSHWPAVFESEDRLGISPVSCYEIALANKKGRLELPYPANKWFEAALEPAGIELFPLTAEIASRAVALSDAHRDPFDRMIIATALSHGSKLASVDSVFSRYDELKDCLMV